MAFLVSLALICSQEGAFGEASHVVLEQGGLLSEFHRQHWSTDDGLPSNLIHAVLQTRDGYLWAATSDGLVRFDGFKFTVFDRVNTPEMVNGNALRRRVFPATRRSCGCMKTALVRFGLAAATEFTVAILEVRDSPGLKCQRPTLTLLRRVIHYPGEEPGREVRSLAIASNGTLWVGTGRGLHAFNDGRVVATYTSANGLPTNDIRQVLEDDSGGLWISCDRGIYRINKQELEDVAAGRAKSVSCVGYDEFDGIVGNRPNGLMSEPAGCKTRDGRLWFAPSKGAVVIDPRHLPDNPTPPPVVIEQVRANDKIILRDGVSSVVTPESSVAKTRLSASLRAGREPWSAENFSSVSDQPRVRLPPGGARVLEFRFAANTFIAPEKARFKCKLENCDDDWQDTGTRRMAYYANLTPGNYRFRVIACNHHNVWNQSGATFAFFVAPHFYENWWFAALCAAAVAGSAAGIYRWQLRLVRRIAQQTALTQERQRIARDMHDDLSAGLSKIARLSDLALARQPQADPVRDCVGKISVLADQMVNSIRDVVWTTNPDFDSLENLVAYVRETAAQILESTHIETAFRFPDQVPRRTLSAEFRRHVLLISKEALQNVVKHSEASRVEIRLALVQDALELEITDNGRGFDTRPGQPLGNGLQNMRHRVAQLRGLFELRSRPGEGTRLSITVPLPPV